MILVCDYIKFEDIDNHINQSMIDDTKLKSLNDIVE
jgi:hypothetical protein